MPSRKSSSSSRSPSRPRSVKTKKTHQDKSPDITSEYKDKSLEITDEILDKYATIIKEYKVKLPKVEITEEDRLSIRHDLLEIEKGLKIFEESLRTKTKADFPKYITIIIASRHILRELAIPLTSTEITKYRQEKKEKLINYFTNKKEIEKHIQYLKDNRFKYKVRKVPVSYFLKEKAKPITLD